MLVEYRGHQPFMAVEYNGKRYAFSKTDKIKDIPHEVYDYVKSCNQINSCDLVPHIVVGKTIDISKIQAENAALKDKVSELEKEIGKLKKKAKKDKE